MSEINTGIDLNQTREIDTGISLDNPMEVAFTIERGTTTQTPTDATLSIAGQAADAAAVGQQVSRLDGVDEGLRTDVDALQTAINGIFNRMYPVGSIYMTVEASNPSTLFGGTWEQIRDRFLLACGTTYANGESGGESVHRLLVDELPSHGHQFEGVRTQTEEQGTPHTHKVPAHSHGLNAHTHDFSTSYTGEHTHGLAMQVVSWPGQQSGANSWSGWTGPENPLVAGVTATNSAGGHEHNGTTDPASGTTSDSAEVNTSEQSASHSHYYTPSGTVKNSGADVAHNNMPPYLAVFVWKRIA